MLNYYDLSGKKFGKLTVKKFAGYHFEKSEKRTLVNGYVNVNVAGQKLLKDIF